VTTKNVVFWGVTPCRYCINRSFGGTYRLHLQGRRKNKIKIRELGPALQPPAHSGSRARIFSSTLKMEVMHSSETSVYTISTRRHIPEDGILQLMLFRKNNHLRIIQIAFVHSVGEMRSFWTCSNCCEFKG
jgi:hypothetical protein